MILKDIYNYVNKECTFEILKDWSIVYVSGINSTQYLNSQITINLFKLTVNHHRLCAHCHSSGKIQSIMRVFHYKNGYAYIQRTSVCKMQMNELKKYSVFSKVRIIQLDNFILLGLSGIMVRSLLLNYFSFLPDELSSLIIIQDIIILWIKQPFERFILIIKNDQFFRIKKFLLNSNFLQVYNKWFLLDIISGFPIIEDTSFRKFFPQQLNLDVLKVIDFKKGCYCGQEVISKIYYRNINNKKMYCLFGKTHFVFNIFSFVEIYNHDRWEKVGSILCFIRIQENICIIQCVLKKICNLKSRFRISDDKNSIFYIL